jgi:hypothetical protein
MRKTILAGLLILMVGIAFAGFELGTVITQRDLDAKTKEEIQADTTLSFSGVEMQGDKVLFKVVINRLAKSDINIGAYEVKGDLFYITFSKEALNNCIAASGLERCGADYIKPYIYSSAANYKEQSVTMAESWKTKGDNFTLRDLEGLINDKELNEAADGKDINKGATVT